MLYIRKGTTNTIKVNIEDMDLNNPLNDFQLHLRNLITDDEQSFSFGGITGVTAVIGKRFMSFQFIEPTNLALVDEGSYAYRITATNNGTVNRGLARVHEGPASASTIYGDEVTYTEHTNITTNTQYITI